MDYFFLSLFTIFLFLRPMDFIPWFQGANILDLIAGGGLIILLPQAKNLYRGPHNIFILGFFIAGLLSHIVHTNLQGTINAFLLSFKLLITYLFVANVINTPKRFKNFLGLISILCLILALNSLRQVEHGVSFFGNVEPLKSPVFDSDGNQTGFNIRIRGNGTFNDPNDLGQILVFGAMISLGYVLIYPSILVRLVHLIFIMTFNLAIYYTNSRGTILALIGSIGYYVVFKSKKLYPKIIGGILILFVFLFGPSRVSYISASGGVDRLELWSIAITLFKHNPLFGVGMLRFEDASHAIMTAHQSYLLVLSELGIVGYFFWFGLIFISFLTLFKIRKQLILETALGRNTLLLFNITEASLFGFLVAAYFLSRSYQLPLFLFLGLSPAMVSIIQNIDPAFKFTLTTKDWYYLICGVLGSALFLYLATRFLWQSVQV